LLRDSGGRNSEKEIRRKDMRQKEERARERERNRERRERKRGTETARGQLSPRD